jgi:heparin/heparan-sulfate lyase
MQFNLKFLKWRASGVRIAAFLFLLSFPTSAFAATVGEIARTGSYKPDGSYRWSYTCRINSTSKTPEQVTLSLLSPNDFPFTVSGLPKTLAVDTLSSHLFEFSINVPTSYIKEPVDTRMFKLKLELKEDNRDKTSVVFSVRGPLPEHPRLFLRKGELGDIKRRFNSQDFLDIKRIFNEQKSYGTDGKVTSDEPNEQIRQKMEALALEYMTNPDTKKASGNEAIILAINYLNSYAKNRTMKAVSYEDNTNTYEAIQGSALVYDWCYPLLTDQQKTNLRAGMKKVCLLGEYGLPGTNKVQFLSGHYGECAPTIFMAVGIATYDEDPSFFDFEYNEQVTKFAPSRNPMYKAGTHHQGAQYIHVRYTNELLQHFMLNKLGISPYVKEITDDVFRAVYDIIPQRTDMDGMPEGDGHNRLEMGYSELFYLAANLSKDPVLQTISKKFLPDGAHQSARLFIYHNPDIAAKPIDSLCLSRFFPSPSGIMIARTKWDIDKTDFNSNAMVVVMNMKEYNAQNHTHLDAGHFGIFYKGHLALDAGIYQGKDPGNGWAKLNYTNYYARTIAHNSLLILDPNEPLPVSWDKKAIVSARDGGQFFFSDHAWDNSRDMFDAGKSSEILAEEIAPGLQPDYSYFKGDITNAYNVPKFIAVYPPKAETVRRSFVFLNHKSNDIPGTLIVLDKVISTNALFKKTWLLHSQNEPVIAGNKITAVNTDNGRNGKLLTTILLPESSNRVIDKTGGPGKEYWADGKNWGSVTQEDAGCWRIELSPVKSALSDNFLNVIQAMDAGYNPSKQTIATAYSENGEYVALQIKDRIVAEQLALGKNDKVIKFTLGDKNTVYKILITDLKAGKWKVTTLSGVKQFSVSENSGTIYFEALGGTFLAEKE